MPTLVYDADCGFCALGGVRVRAQRRRGLAVAGVAARRGRAQRGAGLVGGVLAGRRRHRRGARAVAAALRSCGPGRGLLGRAIDLPPVRRLAAAGYAVVARYRYRYRLPGGTDACRVPPRAVENM